MWSKTRQVLKEKLANSLKDRIDFHYDFYRIKNPVYLDLNGYRVFSILVDGKMEFRTTCKCYENCWKKVQQENRYHISQEDMEREIRENGNVGADPDADGDGNVHGYLHEYMQMNIDDAFNSKNYFIKMLALLDKRVGKRRLEKLIDNIENEPEWFKKWIMIRCDAEGIKKKCKQNETTV